MIPVRLKLKNFMSYKEMEEPLDFSSIHTACLTGANGQGKSTLLDAITWVIWGKARAKRADDLVRLGEDEAQVEFEFQLGHELYRLIRSRNIKGRGRSNLEFQVFEESQGKYRSLTDRSIRETQDKVNNVLRMDYDTFVNSAFILQGKADSFTLKTPSSRKQVLAEILNLNTYDLLEKKARKLSRKAEVQIQILTKSINEIDKELEHKKDYERDFRKYESQLKKSKQSIEQHEKKVVTLRENANDLATKNAELVRIKEQIEGSEKDFVRLTSDIRMYQSKIKEYESILAKKDEIESHYSEFVKCQDQEEALSLKEEKYSALLEQKKEVEKKIDEAKHALDKLINELEQKANSLKERKSLGEKIIEDKEIIEKGFNDYGEGKKEDNDLKKKQEEVYDLEKEKIALEKEIDNKQHDVMMEKRVVEEKLADITNRLSESEGIEKEIKKIDKKLKELEKKEKKLLEIKEEGGQFRTKVEHLKKLNDQIDESVAELHEKQHLMSHADAKCPLCSSELSEEQRNELTDKFKSDLDDSAAEKKKNKAEITRLKKSIDKKLKEYEEIKQALSEVETCRTKKAELSVLDEKRNSLLEQKPEIEKILADIEKVLEEKTYAKEEFAKLEEIDAKINKINYSREEHNEVRGKLEELSKFITLKDQLEKALEECEDIDSQLPDLEKEVGTKKAEYESGNFAKEENEKSKELDKEIKDLGYNHIEHESLRRRIKKLSDYQIKKVKLDQADKLLMESKEQLEKVEYALESKRSDKGKLINESEILGEKVKNLPKINLEIKELERKLITSRRDEAMNRTSLGRMEERLQYCAKLEEQKKEKQAILDKEKEKKGLSLDLSYAFSKKGIQAFIIENAIPDIELEANRILKKITYNKMVVKMETQKMKGGGGSSETLDITISDELGTRPYEVFSGGEAFRINFAIRLALSKLLSKRAGTKLQTLVIDEGFGTQDAMGKERLVEILNAISDEFEKILVITHLEDLQDMFPARIEVTKTEEAGSQVAIV